MLQNAERYGTYLAGTVNNTGNPVILARENIGKLLHMDKIPVLIKYCGNLVSIVVNAEVVDTSNVSDIVFPATNSDLENFTAEINNTAQITIPAEAITALNPAESSNSWVHIGLGYIFLMQI